ncbi:MAG: DUF2336 domain-containing protein [Alphaproteobacteria bacterium]|nr:DUF2336 domain-containing protein [Alphaproteobacteria bacterium]
MKRLAASASDEERVDLAQHAEARPEVLYYLASDQSGGVRQAIAANPSTPVQADKILASDVDEEVRAKLAEKIGRLLPNLPPESAGKLRDRVLEVLSILVEDQLPRVRRILAEQLKDSAAAPPDVIQRLARDPELSVAAPVLQYSPLLSDQDLLDIIASAPVQGALTAISRRRGLGSGVADAVVAADDAIAIAALLANDSAQIREETLDRIVNRAPDNEGWHEPLVLRRMLPPRLIRRLASFVTSSLLNILAKRDDLDADMAVELAFLVKSKLGETTAATPDSSVASQVARLHAEGKLTEDEVKGAIDRQELAFVIHALAVRGGLQPPAVHKMLDSKSGKAVTALAWKAGFTMDVARLLQHRVAKVPPSSLVHPKNGDQYPLTERDMDWYVSFHSG